MRLADRNSNHPPHSRGPHLSPQPFSPRPAVFVPAVEVLWPSERARTTSNDREPLHQPEQTTSASIGTFRTRLLPAAFTRTKDDSPPFSDQLAIQRGIAPMRGAAVAQSPLARSAPNPSTRISRSVTPSVHVDSSGELCHSCFTQPGMMETE